MGKSHSNSERDPAPARRARQPPDQPSWDRGSSSRRETSLRPSVLGFEGIVLARRLDRHLRGGAEEHADRGTAPDPGCSGISWQEKEGLRLVMGVQAIYTAEDLASALAEIENLRRKAEPGPPKGDRIVVLSELIRRYERKHLPAPAPSKVIFNRETK